MPPNNALQLPANPLRGLSAVELGRYVADGTRWKQPYGPTYELIRVKLECSRNRSIGSRENFLKESMNQIRIYIPISGLRHEIQGLLGDSLNITCRCFDVEVDRPREDTNENNISSRRPGV